jgi:hypothetical protein
MWPRSWPAVEFGISSSTLRRLFNRRSEYNVNSALGREGPGEGPGEGDKPGLGERRLRFSVQSFGCSMRRESTQLKYLVTVEMAVESS